MATTGRVERASDRWISIVLSVLLHGALVAAVAYGWWSYRSDRPEPTLAIDATVVDARSVPGLASQPPQPQPPPPPPEPQPQTQPQVEPDGPPQPTPEELERRDLELKQQAEQEAAAKQLQEDQKRAEQEKEQEAALAEEKAAQEKREQEQRLEEQKQAQAKAEADRKAREAAEAKKHAEEEQKRLEQEQKQAQAQDDAARQADLQRSLEEEQRQDAVRSSGAMATWQSQITERIHHAWIEPPSAKPDLKCDVYITQVPGGEVTNVRIGSCNGDESVRESIQVAVGRASPLPPPPDPALFVRNLQITFRALH